MPSSDVHRYLSHGEMKGRGTGDILEKRSGASGAALTDKKRSRFPVPHDGRLGCMKRRACGIPQPPPVGPDHLHLQPIRRTELSESPFEALSHQRGQHVGLLVRHRAHADARPGGARNDRGVVAGRLMNRKERRRSTTLDGYIADDGNTCTMVSCTTHCAEATW